jgi:ubiquinone biosynthesis protein UbiJ
MRMTPVTGFINHVLGQQPWASEALAAHAGGSFALSALPITLTFKVNAGGGVEQAPAGAADVTLSLPASRLPLLFLDPDGAMKEVRIDGDAEFAQTLARLAREVRWDAEEDLSRFVGDVAAHQFMQLARAFRAWGREAGQRLAQTTGAYLQDEDPTLARKSAVEQFGRDVATLRDDCARLEKRLQLLQARPPAD